MSENSSVGCYGKLPIFADFIRYNADGAEVERLDQWIQESLVLARAKLGSGWDAAYRRAPVTRLVFRVPNSPRFLAGVCAPGTDKAGRLFPFLVFSLAPCAPVEQDAPLLPDLYRPFTESAQDLALGGWKDADLRQLQVRVDALPRVDPVADLAGGRTRYAEYVKGETNASFWSAAAGSFDGPAKGRVVRNLIEALQWIRKDANGKSALGLRFPLPAAPSGGSAECFWLDLAFRISGLRGVPPLVYWNAGAGEAPRHLTLFLSAPTAKCFAPALFPDLDSDHVWDLSQGDDVAPPEPVRVLLSDPDLKLAEVLERLPKAVRL
ncbi:MAG: type VI secretion system-associated protein TagF [Planctomycetes bacterium]|nr:type VI secretion system-associated protein TagF [Planctomycetota bacterium]